MDAYMTWSLPLVKMFYVPEKRDDYESFYRRMNYFTSANDSVENDVKYCLRCWAAAKQRVAIIDKSYTS